MEYKSVETRFAGDKSYTVSHGIINAKTFRRYLFCTNWLRINGGIL